VHNVEQLHDGSSIVGDGGCSVLADEELVHAPGTEGGPHGLNHHLAGIDVGNQLLLSLGIFRALFQEDNLRLLKINRTFFYFIFSDA
jgi:hypothetical protein